MPANTVTEEIHVVDQMEVGQQAGEDHPSQQEIQNIERQSQDAIGTELSEDDNNSEDAIGVAHQEDVESLPISQPKTQAEIFAFLNDLLSPLDGEDDGNSSYRGSQHG